MCMWYTVQKSTMLTELFLESNMGGGQGSIHTVCGSEKSINPADMMHLEWEGDLYTDLPRGTLRVVTPNPAMLFASNYRMT